MMIYFRFQIVPVALARWRSSSHSHGRDKTAESDRKQIVKPEASASNCTKGARREEKDTMIGADTKQALIARREDQDWGRMHEGRREERSEGRNAQHTHTHKKRILCGLMNHHRPEGSLQQRIILVFGV